MPLAPGTRFGPYEILAPIGSGGMGEVYRARDSRLLRDVAIKVLPENSSADRDAIARFQREAQAASALNHPHILTIYDVGELDESGRRRNFIAMEYILGETLRERVARDNDLDAVVDLLIQIGDGLAKAHEANIVHRDLKPDNIMVTSDGYAKILDFGLAKLLEPDDSSRATTAAALTAAGAIVGTLGYLAPEQVSGGAIDQRSDIFSFGCIAYEAVTRQRAFPGKTAIEILHQVASAEPPPLRRFNPRVPPELQRVVSRCLAKDPGARYSSMKEVLVDLRRLREKLHDRGVRTLPRLVQVTFDKAIEQFPAISKDGTGVVFSREVGTVRKLFLTRLGESGEEQLTGGAFDDILPSWSPSGDSILFVRSRESTRVEQSDVLGRFVGGDIWRLEVDSHKASNLLGNAFCPAWSPDGRRIAFDASWSGPRRIWISDHRGRNPEQLTTDVSDAVSHIRPRWSPDGRCIVFQTLEGPKFDARVIDVASKKICSVTDDYTMDLNPMWSPDGEWIYLSSYRSGGINLWRIPVDVDGTPIGPLEQVTFGPGHDVDIDISAEGRIVFAILKQNADLWRLPVDPRSGEATGEPEAVVESTRENSRGAWSPDGKAIAFSSDRAGEMNLYLLNLSDGKIRQLTRGAGGDFQPNWVARRTIAGLLLRPCRRAGHLAFRFRFSGLDATHIRRRNQHQSVFLARWNAHRVHVRPGRTSRGVGHEWRWIRRPSVDDGGCGRTLPALVGRQAEDLLSLSDRYGADDGRADLGRRSRGHAASDGRRAHVALA